MDAPLLFMGTKKQSQPHRRQYKQPWGANYVFLALLPGDGACSTS